MVQPHPRRVLVDSAAYLALADPNEQYHRLAQVTIRRLAAERWRVFTTNFIIAETHALILTRHGRDIAARVVATIDASDESVIVRASAGDERRARAIIDDYDDKDFSLTDAISFAVMERLRIGHAFTFDRHFAQYGFSVLGRSLIGG